jgi:hypothetical protein
VRFGEAQVEVGKGRRESKKEVPKAKLFAVRLLSVEGRLTSRRTGRFEAIDKGTGLESVALAEGRCLGL